MVEVRQGDLLIAPTNMMDPRFRSTVILITQYTGLITMGLCLNKTGDYSLEDINRDIPYRVEGNYPLYWGGPVHEQTVWLLHDSDWAARNTINIDDHWSVTSNTDMFRKLSEGYWPQRFRLMYGYASWRPGQLEQELEGSPPYNNRSSWLVLHDPDPDWLYETPEEDLWASAVQLCGLQAVAQWMP